MSTTEKKPQPSPGQANAPSPPPSSQAPPSNPPATRGPLISRRMFLQAAVGGSAALVAASLATSGGILGPLVPPAKGPATIANIYDAELDPAKATNFVEGPLGRMPYKFFYWPYDPSVSPYYRNVLARVPDSLPTTDGSVQTVNGKYVAYNTTCVHLQCLVNPGYADNQYRLQCPCHGSQYEINDAVPQRGPAADLGLGRLPRIRLGVDAQGNIIAKPWDASDNLEGVPGIGLH